jgi:nucleotidyltransferase/DNA polymerase involved in DNA repair
VTTVRGVGPAFAEKLAEIGISNAGQLMTYDANRLALKLGIAADRATDIIREARSLMPPR